MAKTTVTRVAKRRLRLHPLKFDEVITDVLKIKPEPKPPRRKKKVTRKPRRAKRR